MKTILISAITLINLSNGWLASGQKTDPVKKANEANEKKEDTGIIDTDVAEFLVKSADARMMGSFEGKLAAEKGTTSSIREYGEWMISEQATLLEEVKKLAAKRSVYLPEGISNKKEMWRKVLANKDGKDFDEKFIKMMRIDHKRDVRLFKKAIKFDDKELSDFAQKYLPVIQSHLDKLNDIKSKGDE